ncbi:unnamed protein product [Eruca vesicaria subsp. sativa]|uniref:Beta-glucosidase n=1 Tax=Eruca vesicaria subsp. sativa TaxID=29727 RepID=A0ABC8K1V5_ERUVS|nr:unnamed protein product [Eruca vesicaria subsp. sativa]
MNVGGISNMDLIYKNPNEPVEARIQDLLQRMTVEEKIGQITQIHNGVSSATVIKNFFIGSVCNTIVKKVKNESLEEWAEMIDGFQTAALETRLGIPIIYGLDAPHGNSKFYGTTIFPHNIGLGATRDEDLARRIGTATALEIRASGAHWVFAPCVAVCKDPRWGRCYESYSEETDVVCKMTSFVSGLQGTPPQGHPAGYPFLAGRNNVVACAKHFVGDGGTEKGKNEGNTILSYEDLEKIHIPPYLKCFDQGVSTVMASYSSWNGSRLHADRFLLTEVLKKKLGFKGCLVSDWSGIDRMSEPRALTYRECVAASMNAGIDMVMVPHHYERFINDLTDLVQSGEIPMSRIDDAVERILRLKFTAGLFEHPFSDRSLQKFVGCKEHREIAREAVRKSLVLLKNGKDSEKPFLPLDRNANRILVAGTHADDIGFQCGGWSKTFHGLSGPITIGKTVLDAVKASVGSETEVVYDKTPSEETFSGKDFSYAIVVVGEAPYAETLGDDPEPSIHFGGTEVMRMVAEKIPTLVILITGRPVVLDPAVLEKVEALVAAWLPGTEGDGITDVVFGDYDFSGKLPMSWFRTAEQLPINSEAEGYDPLFPVGFGLKCKKW